MPNPEVHPRFGSQMGNSRNEPRAGGAENPNESIIIVHLFCAGRRTNYGQKFPQRNLLFSRSNWEKAQREERERKRAFCRADMRRTERRTGRENCRALSLRAEIERDRESIPSPLRWSRSQDTEDELRKIQHQNHYCRQQNCHIRDITKAYKY